MQPDTFLVDLKTSSGVYEEYHLQVAGYQGACVESGYEQPEPDRHPAQVTLDGKYEFVQGKAEWLDFWLCKGLYDSLQRSRSDAMSDESRRDRLDVGRERSCRASRSDASSRSSRELGESPSTHRPSTSCLAREADDVHE